MSMPEPVAAPSILLVEDDGDTANVVSELLSREGYRVIRAANGQQALRVLEAGEQPALIFCDLMMPVMSGWEFVAQLKSSAEHARIPVVAWSGNDFYEDGVGDAFLRKPVNAAKLLRVVRSHIKRDDKATG